MKGYKVFNPDWTCNGFQFEVGKVFKEKVTPVCCKNGFHFCTKLVDCFSYYKFDPNNKVAEIDAIGEIDTENRDSKCCTNKIHIIRELTWQEVLDLVNIGKDCTGFDNTGDNNTGNHNTGDYNNGSSNTGNNNDGYHNTGDYNNGNSNTGNNNDGYLNTGNCNAGGFNTGNNNSGNRNTGDNNTGNHNTGDYNNGDGNTGYKNSGNYNTGDNNTGNYNTGDNNTGYFNSGYWNSGNYNTGCFNTKSPKINMFDKQSDLTLFEWISSDANRILNQMPPVIFTNDRQKWWDSLPKISKEIVINIPNFDKDIFKEITGIEV